MNYDPNDFRTILMELRITTKSIDAVGLTPALQETLSELIKRLQGCISEISQQLEFLDVDLAMAEGDRYQELIDYRTTLVHKRGVIEQNLQVAKGYLAK